MIKQVLEHIGGVGLYGTVSLCLFFMVFSGMLIWSIRLRPGFCHRMEALPLNDGSRDEMKGDCRHE